MSGPVLFLICEIFLHVREAFEDASGSKYARVLNMALLYMQGLHKVLNICLNMAQYATVITEYLSIYLNMAKYC